MSSSIGEIGVLSDREPLLLRLVDSGSLFFMAPVPKDHLVIAAVFHDTDDTHT